MLQQNLPIYLLLTLSYSMTPSVKPTIEVAKRLFNCRNREGTNLHQTLLIYSNISDLVVWEEEEEVKNRKHQMLKYPSE